MAQRQTTRAYKSEPLTLVELSQLLWAANGWRPRSRRRRKRKVFPSAGATYPLVIYAASLDRVYRYDADEHSIDLQVAGDKRPKISGVTAKQLWLAEASIVLLICAEFERTTGKYTNSGEKYVLIEVGASMQNILLQAVSLGLQTAVLGGFSARRLVKVIQTPEAITPILLITVGHSVDS